jgi:ribonuclease HI
VMIDTGATISCLPEKGLIMKRCSPKTSSANLNVKLADDSYSHMSEKTEVTLKPMNASENEAYQRAQFYIQKGATEIFGHQALIGLNVFSLFNLHITSSNCIIQVHYNGRSIGRQMQSPRAYKGSISVDRRMDHVGNTDPSLCSILRKYKAVFTDLGPLPITGKPMRILTMHQRPIFAKQKHYSPEEILNMSPIIEDLKKKGVIEAATSGYAANSKLVKKKNGTWRMVINYIPLNAVTLRDSYALPQIQDIFAAVQGNEFFSTLDCTQGFYQILVDPRDKHKTAFSSPFGNFQFKRCPFGARNSCAAFQAQMNEVFAEGLYTRCVVYVDDILVFGKDRLEHDRNLAWVLSKCAEYNVKIKLEKCRFKQTEVQYLGFVIKGDCIKPIQDKVDEINKGKAPRDKTELRSIVGKLNFYAKFIPNYSKKLEPFRELFRQNRGFCWKPYHQAALDSVLEALNSKPIHALVPRSTHKYVELHVMKDSLEALCIDDSNRLICRASRFLSVAEANYSIIEKQLLTLVMGLNKFKLWIDPGSLTVRTPTKDLEKVFHLVNRPERVERLLLSLPEGFDEFSFELKPSLMTNQKDKINAHLPQEVYYVDGSCRNNGKPGCKATWAVCAEFDRDLELAGYVSHAPSNQSAEVTAAIKACEQAKQSGYESITIVTDSKYLHNAMTNWIDTWLKNDWQDHKKKPVMNSDLFKQLLYAREGLEIEWVHVKGHSDSDGNNRADLLARGLLDEESATLCAARPTARKIQAASCESDEILRQAKDGELSDYIFEDGLVFYVDQKRQDADMKRVYVPEGSRYYLLKLAHDNPVFGGHLGVKKTFRKLSRFWWPQMHKQVEEYIKSCDICQRYKDPKGLPHGYMHNIPVSRIFQHLHLDIIGPVRATDRGHLYIVTATDAFTKWVIAKPVKSIKTSEVLRFLNDNILTIFGPPEVIITDRGSQFTSAEWKHVIEECGLKHNLTCAYHPQSNGIDERVNGTIVRILRNYVDDFHSDWDEKLAAAVYLYNTTVHESTGYSPYQLLYGSDPRSPLREGQLEIEDLGEVRSVRNEMRKEAGDNIQSSQATQKDYYDRNHRQFNLGIGDLVLVKEHTVPSELTKKLYAKWDGPEMITGFIGEPNSPKAVSVIDLTTKKRRNVAIVHVKPYVVRDADELHWQQKKKGGVQTAATELRDLRDFIDFEDVINNQTVNTDGKESYSLDLSGITDCQPLSSSRRVTFADGAPETLEFERNETCIPGSGVDNLSENSTITADSTANAVPRPTDAPDKPAGVPRNEPEEVYEPQGIERERRNDSTIIVTNDSASSNNDNTEKSPYLMEFIQDDSIADPLYVPPSGSMTPENNCRPKQPIRPRKPRNSRSRLFDDRVPNNYNLRSKLKSANVSDDLSADRNADRSAQCQMRNQGDLSVPAEETDGDPGGSLRVDKLVDLE